MKIHIASDLHIDCAPQHPVHLPGGDILILAGDTFEARNLLRNVSAAAPYEQKVKWQDEATYECLRFVNEEFAKYRHVLFVLGNHEHYNGTVQKTAAKLQAAFPANATVLDRANVEIDGVVFVGTTLWTDFNHGDPLTHHIVGQGMNDFGRCITHREFYGASCQEHYRKFRTADAQDIHYRDRDYIDQIAKKNADKPVVVITHHAPTYQSIAPEYAAQTHMNGGYASDVSPLILCHDNIRMWIHGHVHSQFDYPVGNTRVLCNPRGYMGFETIARHFEVLEVDTGELHTDTQENTNDSTIDQGS